MIGAAIGIAVVVRAVAVVQVSDDHGDVMTQRDILVGVVVGVRVCGTVAIVTAAVVVTLIDGQSGQ